MKDPRKSKLEKELVLLTGGNGQLGSDIAAVLMEHGYPVSAKTHDQFDITQIRQVEEVLNRERPRILINAAAFHQVDECEKDPVRARVVNSTAPARLAGYCAEQRIRFIHFSTDYVFDGKKGEPYTEEDLPAPLNAYGHSKYLGEQAVLQENPEAIILRVSGLYGQHPCRAKKGLNFIRLMMKLADEQGHVNVVDDEIVSPTSTLSIARMIPPIMESEATGIMHLSSEGACSWYEFACQIFTLLGRDEVAVNPVKSSAFPGKTPRPSYSVLSNRRLAGLGLPPMPHWSASLEEYLVSQRFKPEIGNTGYTFSS